MNYCRLSLNAFYSGNGMFKKICNIALICRSPQYACRDCSEPTRPLLKSRRKSEAVAIAQERGCHGDSQGLSTSRFVANAVRHNNRPVALRCWVHFSKHIVPSVCGRGGFGEIHKPKPAGGAKLVSHRGREPLCHSRISQNQHLFQTRWRALLFGSRKCRHSPCVRIGS